jgi:ribonuclease HI
MDEENALYCDGGVVGHNPSILGGTWAFRILQDQVILEQNCGYITPKELHIVNVTNNITEMLALLHGLRRLPDDWSGTIYSDSLITIGRASMGWKWKNIPIGMNRIYQRERGRLHNWEAITWTLLQGHPTKAELLAGVGSRGYPVSQHNVWCDRACQEAARQYLDEQDPARKK